MLKPTGISCASAIFLNAENVRKTKTVDSLPRSSHRSFVLRTSLHRPRRTCTRRLIIFEKPTNAVWGRVWLESMNPIPCPMISQRSSCRQHTRVKHLIRYRILFAKTCSEYTADCYSDTCTEKLLQTSEHLVFRKCAHGTQTILF